MEDDEADCKAEEEEEVERDDGVIGDELNIDELPQDVRYMCCWLWTVKATHWAVFQIMTLGS